MPFWEDYNTDDVIEVNATDKYILLSSGMLAYANWIDFECVSGPCPTEVGKFEGHSYSSLYGSSTMYG